MASPNPSRGNSRTGSIRGYKGQKGGAHTRPWRDDKVIIDRVHAGEVPWLEGKSARECLDFVNQYLARNWPKEPPIKIDTLLIDRKRALQLRAEANINAADKHIAELDHAIDQAWRAFREARGESLNRSAFIATVGRLIELKAKLDRSMMPESQINVMVVQAVPRLKGVLDKWMAQMQLTPEETQRGRQLLARLLKEADVPEVKDTPDDQPRLVDSTTVPSLPPP